MTYDATTTRIFDIPPYQFFAVIGVVFASSLFILLLLKYDYDIPRYTKIFLLSGIGLLIGAKFFGLLTGLYAALANKTAITLDTFLNTGIVFYGGMLGFLSTFLLICKKWNKKIDYGVVNLAVVCIPLFHFFGRLGCFFGGCCYGIESNSIFSILYTNHNHDAIDFCPKDITITAYRFPVQLLEAGLNMVIFIVLISLLFKEKCKENLLIVYLFIYATMRIILEFFRGDMARGVWNGISFSQVVSVAILIGCIVSIINKKLKEREYGVC